MAKAFMRNLISCGVLLFFCGSHIAFSENSNNWQALKVDGGYIFVDINSIRTVFPPVNLKSKYIGDYKIGKVKLLSEYDYIIYDFQFDCKNSLIGFSGAEIYNKENTLMDKENLPLFDKEIEWEKIKPSGQGDYQIYRYVCQGVIPHLTK